MRADRGFQDNDEIHANRKDTTTNKESAVPEQKPEECIEKVCMIHIP